MPRVLALLAACAALAVLGATVATGDSRGVGVVCGPAGSHTIASTATARVYSLGKSVYACVRQSKTSYRLGATGICIGTQRAAPFALAKDQVAYGLTECGVDSSSTQIDVRNLTTGKLLTSDPDVNAALVEAYGVVTSLVVKADGAVAWIATESSLGNHARVTQVWRHDRRGLVMLDSGSGVKPASLKLHRSRLRWRHGSQTRRSSLK